jgi:predicted PurR-regulated permease PerM
MAPFLILAGLVLAACAVFWSVMDMVLLGGSLAVVLMPMHHRICGKVRPAISAALITFIVATVLLASVAVVVIILTSNSGVLTVMFSVIGSWLDNPATNPMAYGVPLTKTSLSAMLDDGTALFVNYQQTLVGNLPIIAFKSFVFFCSIFVLILRGEQIYSRLENRLPPQLRAYSHRFSQATIDTLYAIYVVQVAVAVLTFFISIPVFFLLGYGNILFYSFLAAFCELIPILGSSVAFILIGAYALAIGDTRGIFILFIFGYLIVSCLPEIYVRPVLVGRRVKIHPVLMLFGIIGGLLTMGLASFVLGPVIIVLLMTAYGIYTHQKKAPAADGDHQ